MMNLRYLPYIEAIKHPLTIAQRRKMTILAFDVSRGHSPNTISIVFDGNADIGKPWDGSEEDLVHVAGEHVGKKSYTVFFSKDVDLKLREMLADMVELPKLESNQQTIVCYEAPTRYAYTGYRGARSVEVNYEIRDQLIRAYDIFEHLGGRLEIVAITQAGKAYHMRDALDIEYAQWEDLPGRYHDRKTIRIEGQVVILEALMGGGSHKDRLLINDRVVNLAGFTATEIVIHTEDHNRILIVNSTDGRVLPITIDADGGYTIGILSTMPVTDQPSKVLYGPGTYISGVPMAIQVVDIPGMLETRSRYVQISA